MPGLEYPCTYLPAEIDTMVQVYMQKCSRAEQDPKGLSC